MGYVVCGKCNKGYDDSLDECPNGCDEEFK